MEPNEFDRLLDGYLANRGLAIGPRRPPGFPGMAMGGSGGATFTGVEAGSYDCGGCIITVNGRGQITDIVSSGTGAIIQTASFPLLTDESVVVIAPVFATLMSGTLTTTTGDLDILWTGNVMHLGAIAGNSALVVRFRVDGTLITPSGGTDENELRARIASLAYSRRVAVAPGTHAVDVEWSHFGAPGNSINNFALSLPQLFHANLTLQEVA